MFIVIDETEYEIVRTESEVEASLVCTLLSQVGKRDERFVYYKQGDLGPKDRSVGRKDGGSGNAAGAGIADGS